MDVNRNEEQDYQEISRLNNELVNMQRELAKHNVELERLKSNLEIVVAERTAELMQTNEHLSTKLDEHKKAEIALRESEEKFRSVIAQANDGIRLINDQGIICEWNHALEIITGQKREDVMGKPFAKVGFENMPDELRTPEYAEQFQKNLQSHLTSKHQTIPLANSIYAIKHMDGSRRLVQTVVSRISTSQGDMLCGVIRDVTELKLREEERDLAHRDLAQAYDLTLEGWSRALEIRERETAGHSQRVAKQTHRIAQQLGLKGDDLIHLWRGALLHDIGKMGIPDKILLKPGALSKEEWEEMKQHPLYALQMLQNIPYLNSSLDIPYCHHEKWDGTGYPRGLKGEKIPLAARIFSLVDVYDALTSDRSYRKAWGHDETLKYIRQQSGIHFDPQLVNLFLELIENEKDS